MERPTPPLWKPAGFLGLQARIAEERHEPEAGRIACPALPTSGRHAWDRAPDASAEALGKAESRRSQGWLPLSARLGRSTVFRPEQGLTRESNTDGESLLRGWVSRPVGNGCPLGGSLGLRLRIRPMHFFEEPRDVCLAILSTDVRSKCFGIPIGLSRRRHTSPSRGPHRFHRGHSKHGQTVRRGGTK